MPIDASIPLRVKPFEAMRPQEVMSLHNLSQQMRMQDEQMGEIRRKRDVENQLRSLYARPDALDPKTGMPTETTLAQVAQVSPEAYVATRGKIVDAEAKRAEAEKDLAQARDALGKVNERDRKIMGRIQVGAHQAYEKAKAETNDENLAIQAAQEYFTSELSNEDKLGVLSKNFITNSRPFDPKRSAITIEALRSIDAPPRTRDRISGEQTIQEEWDPITRTWKQIGAGPRFARSVAPGVGGDSSPKTRTIFDKDDAIQQEWDPQTRSWKEVGRGKRFGRKDEDVDFRRLKAFGDAIDKANIPVSKAMLDEIKPLVNDPEVARYLTGPESYIPDPLVAKKVQQGRQALQRLLNVELKDRSGAAVVQQEYDRFKKEYAIGLLKTPEQVQDAVARFERIMEKYYAAVAARFPKETRESYFKEMKEVQPYGDSVDGTPSRRATDKISPEDQALIDKYKK